MASNENQPCKTDVIRKREFLKFYFYGYKEMSSMEV